MKDSVGVPVLPIHDSFIVDRSYTIPLKEVMERAYFAKMGKTIEIKVTDAYRSTLSSR